MTATFRFHQLDVFTATPLKGNPLAVVHGADALDAAQMQAFAKWTNLSETTFLLKPTDAGADYRVRIFTPGRELPFAGHPTLGSCHAWLEAAAAGGDEIVQQWAVGWCASAAMAPARVRGTAAGAQRRGRAGCRRQIARCLRSARRAARDPVGRQRPGLGRACSIHARRCSR